MFETLFVSDENGRPLCVPILKATFTIGQGGALELAEEQWPLETAGTYRGDPEHSSCIYEPETAFYKAATDVVLIGHAYAARADDTEVLTGMRVGPVQKLVKVFGDRVMTRRADVVSVSPPATFERIPLTYERAFGGWDRRRSDASQHLVELRNPVGTGFRDASLAGDDEVRMPNLEAPERLLRRYGERPPPAGFGFVSTHWAPRAELAGTYDARWATDRSPLLPEDFDRRFFNAAPREMIAPGYLRGGEDVVILNASPEGRLQFQLPALGPLECRYELRGKKRASTPMSLDTVIVNTDDRRLVLLWRSHFTLRSGPHDVLTVRAQPFKPAPRVVYAIK